MDKQGQVETEPGQSSDIKQQVQQVRELFADAPEVGKTALEKVLREIESGEPSSQPATRMESAGRVGSRQGTVSELTLIVPLAPGGAERLRAILKLTARQLRCYGIGRHCPRHALCVSGQRYQAALRHYLRWRLGPLHRRLRGEDPRLPGLNVLRCRGLPRHPQPRDQGLYSPSTRSQRTPGTSPIRT